MLPIFWALFSVFCLSCMRGLISVTSNIVFQLLSYNLFNCMDQESQFPRIAELDLDSFMLEHQTNQGPFKILTSSEHVAYFLNNQCNWTVLENAKYGAFIRRYHIEMEKRNYARIWVVFKKMAKFIQSRNFRQCKQHHQRLCKKFSDFEEIIHHLTISSDIFLELLNQQSQVLNKLIEGKRTISKQRSKMKQLEQQSERLLSIPIIEAPSNLSTNQGLILTMSTLPQSEIKLQSEIEQELCMQFFKQWSIRLKKLNADPVSN